MRYTRIHISPIVKKRRSTSPRSIFGAQMGKRGTDARIDVGIGRMGTRSQHAGDIVSCDMHSKFTKDAEATTDLVVTHSEKRGYFYLTIFVYIWPSHVGCLALGNLHADIRQSLSNDGHRTLHTLTTSICLTFARHSLCRLFVSSSVCFDFRLILECSLCFW